MNVKASPLNDLLLIEPRLYEDERGFFLEAYQDRRYAQNGIPAAFVQDNHSASRMGTLRGLHYQIRQPQGKLLRVVVGEIFDVAIDLRRSSPTFGQWYGTRMSAENHLQIWVPEGFAHGFYVLSEWAELLYKVTDYYAPEWDRTIRWDDPDLDITWPLIDGQPPLLSEKDAQGAPLREAEVFE